VQSFPVHAVIPCSFTTNQQLELQLQESRSRSATAADADAAKLEDLYAALETSRGEILEEQARSEKLEAQVRALEKAKEEAARAEVLEAKNAQLELQLQELATQLENREELQSIFLELKEAANTALSAAKAAQAAQAEETGELIAEHEAKMEERDKAIEGLERKLFEMTRQLEEAHTEHVQAYSDLLKEFDEYKEESSILEQKLFQDHKVQQQQDKIRLQTQSILDLNDQIKVRLFTDLFLHSTSPDFLCQSFFCIWFTLTRNFPLPASATGTDEARASGQDFRLAIDDQPTSSDLSTGKQRKRRAGS